MEALAHFFEGICERVVAVVLAVTAAQFPLFYNAYGNTVAGVQLEAESRYHELQREAKSLRLGVEEFVGRHERNGDAVFQASGRIHRTTLEHYHRYTAMNTALREAPAWRRAWVLAQNFDPQLYAATRFQPGLPLTAEAAAYALAGVLLAWMLTTSTGYAFRRVAA